MSYLHLPFVRELPLSERLRSTNKCLFCNQDVDEKISISTVVGQKTETNRKTLGKNYTEVTNSYHNFTPFSFFICKKCVDEYFIVGWHKKVWTDRAYFVGTPAFFAVGFYIFALFSQSSKRGDFSGCIAILSILILALAYCVWEVVVHSKTIPSTMPENLQRRVDECSSDGKRFQISIKIDSLVYPSATKQTDKNVVWWYKDDFDRDVEPHLKFKH